MKNKKRNITMIAVLVFVCAAVALNWSYNNRWGHPDSEMVSAEDSAMLDAAAADADAAPAEESTASGYFAEARLTRQVSRDEALELLQTAAAAETASQETIDSAINAISAMATCSMKDREPAACQGFLRVCGLHQQRQHNRRRASSGGRAERGGRRAHNGRDMHRDGV